MELCLPILSAPGRRESPTYQESYIPGVRYFLSSCSLSEKPYLIWGVMVWYGPVSKPPKSKILWCPRFFITEFTILHVVQKCTSEPHCIS